jgi:hypothetical protein
VAAGLCLAHAGGVMYCCLPACLPACVHACLTSICTPLQGLQLSYAHGWVLLHSNRVSRSACAIIVILTCRSPLLLCSNTAMTLMSAGMATM